MNQMTTHRARYPLKDSKARFLKSKLDRTRERQNFPPRQEIKYFTDILTPR